MYETLSNSVSAHVGRRTRMVSVTAETEKSDFGRPLGGVSHRRRICMCRRLSAVSWPRTPAAARRCINGSASPSIHGSQK